MIDVKNCKAIYLKYAIKKLGAKFADFNLILKKKLKIKRVKLLIISGKMSLIKNDRMIIIKILIQQLKNKTKIQLY